MSQTPALPAGIESTVPAGRYLPEKGLTIGRCQTAISDHGVAWPTGTMALHEATCPIHEGTGLSLTTRILGRTFYVMSRDAAKAMAKAVRAERKAAAAARVAAGATKYVKDLEPGDVVRVGYRWVRVLEVGPSDRAKSRLAVGYAVEASEVTTNRPWTTGTAHLVAKDEVDLGPAEGGHVWADLEPGKAAVHLLEEVVATAKRMVPHYRKEAANVRRFEGARRTSWLEEAADQHEADSARATELLELLAAAATAELEPETAAPATSCGTAGCERVGLTTGAVEEFGSSSAEVHTAECHVTKEWEAAQAEDEDELEAPPAPAPLPCADGSVHGPWDACRCEEDEAAAEPKPHTETGEWCECPDCDEAAAEELRSANRTLTVAEAELMFATTDEGRFTYTPDEDGPQVEPAVLARYEAEVAAEAQEAAKATTEELLRARAAARAAGDIHAELVASKALELKPRNAASLRYALALEALAGPLGGQEREALNLELRRAEGLIVDAAARHYGWDHSRVGGYVIRPGADRGGARPGDVFVGSNYAGRVSREELILDARSGDRVVIPLAEVLEPRREVRALVEAGSTHAEAIRLLEDEERRFGAGLRRGAAEGTL